MDVQIDSLKSKAEEVNWMMKPVWFQDMLVMGLKRGKAPGPDGIEVLGIGWWEVCVSFLI